MSAPLRVALLERMQRRSSDEAKRLRERARECDRAADAVRERRIEAMAALATATPFVADATVRMWENAEGFTIASCSSCSWSAKVDGDDRSLAERAVDLHKLAHRYGQCVTVNGKGLSEQWAGRRGVVYDVMAGTTRARDEVLVALDGGGWWGFSRKHLDAEADIP